jgi:hypothetical protein
MIEKIKPYAKAVVAIAIPVVALGATFITGDEGWTDISTGETILLVSAFLVAVSVWAVPNKTTE